MLCYQYTRNATDIIHDTFSWITSNGRLMRLLFAILLPVCILTEYLSDLMVFDFYNKDISVMDAILQHYIPMGFHDEPVEGAELAQYQRYLLMFFVLLGIVPMLRHYFLSRKSLKKITLKRLVEVTKLHLAPTLVTFATAMVAYWLLVVTYETVIFSYMILFFAAFPVSSAIMKGKDFSFQGFSGNFMFSVRYLFLISFVVLVLQILPLYCCGLCSMIVEIMNVSLINMIPAAEEMSKVASFVMGTLTYLSFCFSMIVLFVSLTLFHGAIMEESEE